MKLYLLCLSYSFLLLLPSWQYRAHGEDSSQNEVSKDLLKNAGKKRQGRLPNVGEEEIRMLRRLLEMPPARLKMLRKTIERMENYSEEEREEMKKKLAKFQSSSSGERSQAMDSLLRRHALLKSHWSKLSPERRTTEIKKLTSMSHKERRKFFDDLNRSFDSESDNLKPVN
jgi:hypothetical protein